MTDESDDGVTIDDVKKVSEIGPIKALLTPSAEILGQRMKSSLESWFDKRAAKNIEEHASRVLPKDRHLEASEQSQIDLFDWAEKAGRVSSSEPELSASIQAALRATLRGERDDAEILKSLTKSELLFLLHPDFSSPESYPLQTLQAKSLIKRASLDLSGSFTKSRREREFVLKSLTIVSVTAVGYVGIFYLMTSFATEYLAASIPQVISVALTVVATTVVAACIGLWLFLPIHFRFTEKGRSIREQVQAYLR